MTREEAIKILNKCRDRGFERTSYTLEEYHTARDMAIKALEQKQNIKALGEDMRIFREAITDEKVLIGFNMAVALCNKHLGEGEVKE